MIKAMCKGMTPAQVQVIEEHCTSYRLVELVDGNSKEVDLKEIPWNLYQANKNITFFFKPPQEETSLTSEGGEVIQLVAEEVLLKFEPLNLWGCTNKFLSRHKAGMATLEDLLYIAKQLRDNESTFTKGLQKEMKRGLVSQEKGTIGKAWAGVRSQQDQITFLHETMVKAIDTHIIKPIEVLKLKLDQEKTRFVQHGVLFHSSQMDHFLARSLSLSLSVSFFIPSFLYILNIVTETDSSPPAEFTSPLRMRREHSNPSWSSPHALKRSTTSAARCKRTTKLLTSAPKTIR